MHPYDLVAAYADRIQNGRSLSNILDHASEELDVELREEIIKRELKQTPGPDGIVGEALDVVACMFDLIRRAAPTITAEQLNEILTAKCDKWELYYSDSIHRQR